VHWARWSDALREADFTANQFLNAYEKSTLLDKYAKLTRELGRIPVKGDLRLKSRSDPEFPNDKTFDRIGTKSELVSELLKHCRSQNGYDDIVRLCEEYVNRRPQSSSDYLTSGAAAGQPVDFKQVSGRMGYG
jgi:hypothetical protein